MASSISDEIPPWKKHLIARLRVQNKCSSTGNPAVTVSTKRQLSPPFQSRPSSAGRAPSSQSSAGIPSACNQFSATSSAAKSATNPSFSGKDGTSGLSDRKLVSSSAHRKVKSPKMVQERNWAVDYTSCESVDMVSDRDNYSKTSDSDSSEELHYGPGIVNKLKNKYLSLTLRRENYSKQRPSLLSLRKATSLENMLDEEDVEEEVDSQERRVYQTNGTDKNSNNSSNRYRNSKRGTQDMKRARSVEAISRFENMISPPPRIETTRPKSLHEYILINDNDEGNDKSYRKSKDMKVVELETNIENGLFSNNYVPRLNRPKRIAPVMSEREKPPADVVKQAKMIFEKRPEQRTKPPVSTGEVAARVASYKNIIVQSKPSKKPPIKTKPVAPLLPERTTKNGDSRPAIQKPKAVESPAVKQDKPKTGGTRKTVSTSEITNAPKVAPRVRGVSKKIGEKTQVKEVRNNGKEVVCGKNIEVVKDIKKEEVLSDEEASKPVVQLPSIIPDISLIEITKADSEVNGRLCETPDLILTTSPAAKSTPCDKIQTDSHTGTQNNVKTLRMTDENTSDVLNSESVTPNYCDDSKRERLPVNKSSSNENVPISEPLKLIINGNQIRNSPSPEDSPKITQISPIPPLTRRKIVSPPIRSQKDPIGFDRVVEKNLINAAKSLDQKTDNLVPKKVKRPPREPETNSIVFKFTDRKDVPDYVQNDKTRTAGRLEKPKVGEGGIILLPGASLDDTFTDEDEEIMKFLQAPPSPCDVTFINDNILIDGKSSISQKSKKSRMRISFVESGPDVYEYPSESSLLIDEVPSPVSTTPLAGHTVPTLSGSFLANYIPKSTEEFQPGVTRSTNVPPVANQDLPPEDSDQLFLEEVDQPITFSAGTNSDMLF